MQKIIIIYLSIFTLLPFDGFCQNDDNHKKKHKFLFSFDSRNSSIDGKNTGIFGIKFGLQHNRVHRFGVGIYSLKNSTPVFIQTVNTIIPNENITATVDLFADLNYWALYYEYVFFETTRWEFSAPLLFGFGEASLTYTWNKKRYTYKSVPILSLEPSITGHYKIFSWIGIGAGVGYRYIVYTNTNVNNRLNAPLYILKVKLFLGQIFNSNKN